jgi:myo-inositol 2-dehydrogenase/D-chiro-inositol 1-dehydrogenase
MKVAVIGSGNIARRHIGLLVGEPDVELRGIVAPRPASAAATVRHWNRPVYSSVGELLRQEELDAAWICVPPGQHGEIELRLIEQGIPFFVEKPLSADRQTGEEIGQALVRRGLLAAVGYHWRALDTIPEVQRTLAHRPARLVLGAWHDATPPPEWWRRQATGGGQIVEQATHLFDLARLLVGEASVVAATATCYGQGAYPDADVADASTALLRMVAGATGVFTATCLLGGAAAVHLQLVCEGLLMTITQRSVVYERGRERREVLTGNDPFVDEDRAFLKAVQHHDPTLLFSSYADALRTHRLCFDVLEGSRWHP